MTRTTFPTTLTLVALSLSLSMLAFTPATTVVDGRAIPEIEWKTTLNKFQMDKDQFLGQRFTAMCPPAAPKVKAESAAPGAIYSNKHSICLAGLQSGAIDTKGGVVTVQLNPGGEIHTGKPGTATVRTMSVVGSSGADATNQIYRDHIPRVKWDTKFTKSGFAYKHLIGQQFTFNCPKAPSNVLLRRVKGTDLYAFSSVICQAAVHAGQITMDGGLVTVRMNPTEKKLVGSVRNGIESHDGSSGLSALSFVANPVKP